VTQSCDLAIRMRRAAFNRALAEMDLSAIGPLLSPAAILVTGSDSGVISGRKAQLMAWKREFASPERTIYVRMPTSITASPVEPIAMEQGEWKGLAADTQEPTASGIYSAKWRKLRDEWLIEAEIFVTLG
ncbi:nuclear transport factor 2 family protein, partial [Sphingobium sp. TomTYG45]